MSRLRRFMLLAAGLASACVFAPTPASAGHPTGYPEALGTAHFVVHYSGDPANPGAVLHQTAADVAATAEGAYEKIVTEWGFPPPANDGDGRTDIYITDLPLGYLGFAYMETATPQTSGWIELDVGAVAMPETIAHELFHLVQFGIWAPAEPWLLEATAEWAGYGFLSFPPGVAATLGAPDMSLSCSGDACGFDDYERGGYSRWSFFQYVAERHASTVVKEIFERGAALADPSLSGIDLVSSALSLRGTTLADVFTGWTVANLAGDYTATGLRGIVPPAYSETFTGAADGNLPGRQVAVNHLAARYVAFKRGDGTSSGPCYAATLNLTVALPYGIGARPHFFWTGAGGAVIPLAVSGGTASISLPWDTCSWAGKGLLALPNPSATADSQVFTVSGSLSVDEKTLATSTAPPPSTVTGPVVPAPVTDPPPAISVYGPEILRLGRRTRVIRLVVFSSGPGKLEAVLAGKALGSVRLRAGNNDVRYRLAGPAARVVAQRSTLTLTSIAPTGTTRGAVVTRRVNVVRR